MTKWISRRALWMVASVALLCWHPQAAAQQFIGVGTTQAQANGNFCYLFDAPADTSWQIDLASTNFDAMLTVGAGSGCTVNQGAIHNDDGGSGLNARIRFTSGGGLYFIMGRSYSGAPSGSFTLSVTRMSSGGQRLPGGPQLPALIRSSSRDSASTVAPGPDASLYRPGSAFRDCEAECPQMMVVPAGSFVIGSSATEEGRGGDEGPRRVIQVPHDFAVGMFEVTFDEWGACVAASACRAGVGDNGWGRGRRPVTNVSWTDAVQYVEWLSRRTGQRYFLLSEAEWEYAARAGTTTPWNTGDAIINEDANILNVVGRTVPVGSYPANAFGLHDFHGNVWEYVLDCYDVGYFGVTDSGATISPMCARRIIRGGSYSSRPQFARSANRGQLEPGRTGAPADADIGGIGIRVARAL